MHFDTKKLTRCALIAAIYVALTMLSNALNLAYGPIQLRFSEAMTVLPFLMPEASWGLFIGCVLSNILSPYGPLDMIVGSAATLLAALLTARCHKKWTAALPPVLCNAILIGALIAWEEAGVGNGFPPAFFYNALTAMNGSGQVYASTLGFAVSNGQVDISSVLLDNVKGPFVADASTVLPFAPAAIYRNDEVTTSAALSPYDVYYYNESARTLWIYNKRAAGRVTAVSPSASAPTSVTVAGVTYTIASPSVAYQLSSLSGGGVGQVVTLLLGMNDAAVSVLTGDAADAVFYGVVQSSSRTLVETNSAEVQQAVSVMCTDGTARTVNVDNKLNFPAGKLVEISVDGDGESVQSISPRSTSGTVSADGTALGDTPFADNVQIIDTR